jgi:hypothetical protein
MSLQGDCNAWVTRRSHDGDPRDEHSVRHDDPVAEGVIPLS